jgi:hypothetical protein
MTTISMRVRQIVKLRAKGLCEYCRTQKLVVIFMNVDHIVPTSAGGATTEDNLCLSCPNCNTYKKDHQTYVDPETSERVRLFNPRIDSWDEHFRWSDDYTEVVGLTPIGRATAECLHMNDEDVVNARKVWISGNLHPPKQEVMD